MNALTTLIAATLVIAVGAPVQAQEARSVRVATRALDLSTVKGQRQLKLRIVRAASALCETVNPRFDAGVRAAQRACRNTAIATALASAETRIRLSAR